MNKNDIISIKITDSATDGSGIGKYEGMAVFVPQTAVGDIAEVKIVKLKKSYAYGKLINLLEPSCDRIENDCPHSKGCGGCVYRHISYEAETRIKSNRVSETMMRIGGSEFSGQPILSGQEKRYRNKAQYPISSGGRVGFFAPRSHRVVEIEDCLIAPAEFSRIAAVFEKFLSDHKISVYNEEAHSGLVRHLYIRKGFKTDEIMVCVVINGDALPYREELVKRLKKELSERLKSVVININRCQTNVILGDKNICIYGQEYITDILCGIKVRLSPHSFYQVNRDMAECLYKKAEEYARPLGKKILDLYCGAGTIGLSMAKNAESVIGVEIVPEAVRDARFNAEANGIKNARFICADAALAARQLRDEGESVDVVILDPPRKGCAPELLKIVANEFSPERVVYISCDVATLARDTKILSELGFELQEYTPVDLFPRTAHVETVALLSRQKVN